MSEGISIEQKSLPPTIENNKEIFSGEALRDATYVLFTLPNHDQPTVTGELNRFFQDRQSGANQEQWQEKIKQIKKEHEQKHLEWKQEQLAKQHANFEMKKYLEGDTESEKDLMCVRCDNYPPTVIDGQPFLQTAFLGTEGREQRTSLHVAFNHTVDPVSTVAGGASWADSRYVYLFPYTEAKKANGDMYGFRPEDGWWALGTEAFKLPPGTTVVVQKGEESTAQLTQIPKLTIVETEGKPYFEAETVLEKTGQKVIPPKDFKNARKFADENGIFYGYHLGSASGQGSESYLLAEAIIDRNTRRNDTAAEDVAYFNKFNPEFADWSSFCRFNELIKLVKDEPRYFSPADFPQIDFSEIREQSVFLGYAINAVSDHYYGSNKDPSLNIDNLNAKATTAEEKAVYAAARKIFDRFEELSKNPDFTLPPISGNLLQSELADLRDNFDRIPPQLLGTFLMRNMKLLGLEVSKE